MKKNTILALVVVFSMSIVSCSKSSSYQLSGQGPSRQLEIPRPEVIAVSDWVYPSTFSVGTDRLGNLFIKGVHPFNASSQISYDESLHIELAYVRIPTGQRGVRYIYKRLPLDFKIITNGLSAGMLIDYSLDPDGLKLYFKNADYSVLSRVVDQSISDNWNFRYIVIPKTKYQSTNVDWNDLIAVAAALNFTL